MKVSKYIAVEGADFVGKSTLVEKLKEDLHFKDSVFFREPGGSKLGEDLRKVLLSHKLNQRQQYCLHSAYREENKDVIINPALWENKLVISERCYISSMVYQHEEWAVILEDVRGNDLRVPDLIILFDITEEEAQLRAQERGNLDVIEKEVIKNYSVIKKRYREAVKNSNTDYIIFKDHTPDPEYVSAILEAYLTKEDSGSTQLIIDEDRNVMDSMGRKIG